MKHIIPVLVLIAAAIAAGCGSDSTEPEPLDCSSVADTTQPATVSYSADIFPLFESEQNGGYGCNDSDCHGGNLNTTGYWLRTYQEMFDAGPEASALKICVIKPGAPDESYIYMKITGAPGISGERMPLEKAPMDPADVELMRVWILEGARNN